MTLQEDFKTSNEERKKKEEEMREENKKNLKKNIGEVKQFLMTLYEEMKNNNTKIYESMSQLSTIQNNPKEEPINKKMLDAIIESTNNKSTELENQIKTLVEKIQKISETIENQSKVIIQQKKEEENKFYGCSFVDGNYILNIYHDDLMNMKVLNHDITLINNGTLSWPENAFIYGKSNDNILECKSSTVNKNKEIKPNESVNVRVLVNLKNIQNQNNEITLPIKLFFQDQSIQIKQNGFKVIIKVKETKQISMQEPQMTESNIKKIPPNNQSQINNEQTNTNQNKEDKKNKTNKNSTQTPNPNMQNPSSNEVNQSSNKKNNQPDNDINDNNQNTNFTTNEPKKENKQVSNKKTNKNKPETSTKSKVNTQQQNLISDDMSDDMF